MKESFITHKFSNSSMQMIFKINDILDDYESQGYKLSLRQLYYQLVSKAWIENSVKSYKNIGSLVSDARLAGYIDWDMIEDRGRNTVSNSHWKNPGGILISSAYSFKIDKWENQPWHVEVMVEKDALSGVLEPICKKLDIGITANKGYSSSSTMYEIGQRIMNQGNKEKDICVIYLGDHDPSGIDMTRDVKERLELFSGGTWIDVKRIALNWDQVEEWKPPENPAKETDSRFAKYAEEFGDSSWELDAVEPAKLAKLLTDTVEKLIDFEKWDKSVETENSYIAEIESMAKQYKDK